MAFSQKILEKMIESAKEASKNAYCRFSKFHVGAAIATTSGEIFAGCNVENASYGLTICAERNAVCQLIAKGHREFVAVVVYTPTPTPTSPCGACRQMLLEFSPHAEVISVCDGEEQIRTTVEELLPHAFRSSKLIS